MNFNLNTWIAVGEALDGNWSVGFLASREDAALLREDGLQLVVLESWDTPEGKITVRLSVGGNEWDHIRYGEAVPSINVSPTRKPEVLARDIERRLIPDAEEFRQVILERVARWDEYHRKVDALREQLLATGAVDEPGGTRRADRLYLKRDAGRYGYVTHGDDYAKFEMTLPAEDAIWVLALLAD